MKIKNGWRAGRIGKFLGIHSPTAHAMETCWCLGSKRELPNPEEFATKSKALRAMEDYYRYVSALDDALERGKDRGDYRTGSSGEYPSSDPPREGD
jgi:hypothetical protein